MYTNLVVNVNQLSAGVTVTNGVKQRGILSNTLFTIYIDVFLGMLKDSGVGYYLGNNFMGSLGYADDICSYCTISYGL